MKIDIKYNTLQIIHLDAETAKDEPSLRGRLPWHMRFLRGSWKKGTSQSFLIILVMILHFMSQSIINK